MNEISDKDWCFYVVPNTIKWKREYSSLIGLVKTIHVSWIFPHLLDENRYIMNMEDKQFVDIYNLTNTNFNFVNDYIYTQFNPEQQTAKEKRR